jgi:hypothetical protein
MDLGVYRELRSFANHPVLGGDRLARVPTPRDRPKFLRPSRGRRSWPGISVAGGDDEVSLRRPLFSTARWLVAAAAAAPRTLRTK